jgi:hypothetical protein
MATFHVTCISHGLVAANPGGRVWPLPQRFVLYLRRANVVRANLVWHESGHLIQVFRDIERIFSSM